VGFVTAGPEITNRPPKRRTMADKPAAEHS